MRLLPLILFLAFLPGASCNVQPIPPDPGGAGGNGAGGEQGAGGATPGAGGSANGDVFDAMCANLSALKCPEGEVSNCASSARNVGTPSAPGRTPLTLVPTVCLTSARTKEEARACGFVKCL